MSKQNKIDQKLFNRAAKALLNSASIPVLATRQEVYRAINEEIEQRGNRGKYFKTDYQKRKLREYFFNEFAPQNDIAVFKNKTEKKQFIQITTDIPEKEPEQEPPKDVEIFDSGDIPRWEIYPLIKGLRSGDLDTVIMNGVKLSINDLRKVRDVGESGNLISYKIIRSGITGKLFAVIQEG